MTVARRGPPAAWWWAAASALLVAGLGGLMTDIGPWYLGLKQPAWKPPDLAFGPIWTVIFTLTAIAGVQAWNAARRQGRSVRWLWLFALNGLLNVLWSLLYFRLQRPDWALMEVPLLWLSVLAIVVALWPFARRAALLVVPYLVWVSIAALLNWQTVQLNGPFGG